MSISKFRSLLYGSAKYLGDVQAIGKAGSTGSLSPVYKRLARRAAGRATGGFLGKLFR